MRSKICPKNQPISAILLKHTTNDSQKYFKEGQKRVRPPMSHGNTQQEISLAVWSSEWQWTSGQMGGGAGCRVSAQPH